MTHCVGVKARSTRLKFVCRDMWAPYLKVIKKKAPQAMNVLTGFTSSSTSMRPSTGFVARRHGKTALYHTLGKLPEPKITHRFC